MSFGAQFPFSKLRANKNISIVWRMRLGKTVLLLLFQNLVSLALLPLFQTWRFPTDKNHKKELVPVRPVAVLSGSVSLTGKQVIQLV